MTICIGITGGIGSGKSTFGQFLENPNAVFIDADQISRHLTAKNGGAIEKIRQVFGDRYIAQDNSLNRDSMRQLIFDDASMKKKLEDIIHPMVRDAFLSQAVAADREHKKYIFLDVPLMVHDCFWQKKIDVLISIECEVETQIQRVIKRSNLSRPTIESIIDSQCNQKRRRSADIIIHNGITTHLHDLRKSACDLNFF